MCLSGSQVVLSLSLSLFFFSRPYQYTKRVLCTPEPRVHSRQSRKQPWTSFGIIYGPMWNVTSYVTFDFHTSWSGRVSERVREGAPQLSEEAKDPKTKIYTEKHAPTIYRFCRCDGWERRNGKSSELTFGGAFEVMSEKMLWKLKFKHTLAKSIVSLTSWTHTSANAFLLFGEIVFLHILTTL